MIDNLHHRVGFKVFAQPGDINIKTARAEKIIIAPNLEQEDYFKLAVLTDIAEFRNTTNSKNNGSQTRKL